MITLTAGGTTLTLNHVLWTDRAQGPGAAGSERVTLGGRLVVQRLSSAAGRSITIEAVVDGNHLKGWFAWSQVQQLMAWRDAGTTITADYDGEVRSAIIPLTGIDLAPLFPRSNEPLPDTRCVGTLTMIEV